MRRQLVSGYHPWRFVNARAIKRNTRGRGSVEVWWWMYLDDSDLYYRLLGAGLRSLLKLCGALRISAISAIKMFCERRDR